MDANPKEKIILAVDAPDYDSAARLLDPLAGELCWAKIGLQLFVSEGPRIVSAARERGLRIFLDLKFHDIPNTAREAVLSARKTGASITTIHLAGGPAMVAEAANAAGEMLVLGVTVLTSMDAAQLCATGVSAEPSAQVVALAKMGQTNGLRGFVASPLEIRALREACGPDVTIVTPGIRPAGSDKGDQSRIATPASAIRDGANYLVIGRPISAAPSPRDAFLRIAEEIASV